MSDARMQVACSTCGHVNQVPYTSGVVDFRCNNCGKRPTPLCGVQGERASSDTPHLGTAFMNSYRPPRANGGCRDVHLMPVPIFCNIM